MFRLAFSAPERTSLTDARHVGYWPKADIGKVRRHIRF